MSSSQLIDYLLGLNRRQSQILKLKFLKHFVYGPTKNQRYVDRSVYLQMNQQTFAMFTEITINRPSK